MTARDAFGQPVSIAVEIANDFQCPDCAAEKKLERDASGVLVLTVLHDLTCPWLSQREEENDHE